MADELKTGKSKIRLEKADIADLDIEAFVYYARHDLALGSGFGTAITIRGGPTVQQELDKLGPLETTQVVASAAGEMKAKHIIHAVGPRFQEEDLPAKLRTTITNALKCAEDKGIKHIALPPMGAGFYGVPLDLSAQVTLDTVKKYLENGSSLEEVVICLLDNREYKPFAGQLAAMKK
jgi:O-acetyl-ADP-ribose deacetylase (regulator of RNase III)